MFFKSEGVLRNNDRFISRSTGGGKRKPAERKESAVKTDDCQILEGLMGVKDRKGSSGNSSRGKREGSRPLMTTDMCCRLIKSREKRGEPQ